MNNYQQKNTNVNISPYQQNIDIIKNFFKKPIILVNAIFDTAAIPFTFLLLFSLSNWFNYFLFESYSYNSIYSLNRNAMAALSNLSTTIIMVAGLFSCIPAILSVVSKFLIYAKSKNSDPNVKPSAGFTILWVMSIISVCFLGLNCLITIFYVIVNIFSSSSTGSFRSAQTTETFVIALVLYLILFAVAFFYIINQIRFYSSVRKSLNSIYLKKDGAMIFGVFRIISGVLSCLSFLACAVFLMASASVFFSSSGHILIPVDFVAYVTIIVALGAVSNLTSGIIAVKYAGYITNILFGTNQQFNANLPYTNPVPVNTFDNSYPQPQQMQDNPYVNTQDENPYANPQQINPQAPQEPVSIPDNQYYQPVENSAPQNTNSVKDENSMSNVCPNCGSHVFRSDMFCNNCGFKLK